MFYCLYCFDIENKVRCKVFLWLLFLSLSFFQASPELTETSQDRWFPKEGNSCVLVPGQGQSSVLSLYPGRTQTPVSGSARPGHSGHSNEFLTARNIPPDHNRRGRVSPANLMQFNCQKLAKWETYHKTFYHISIFNCQSSFKHLQCWCQKLFPRSSSPPPPVFAAPTQSVASGIRPGHESLGEMRERDAMRAGGKQRNLTLGPH